LQRSTNKRFQARRATIGENFLGLINVGELPMKAADEQRMRDRRRKTRGAACNAARVRFNACSV
jgi:hypothetical protein